MERTEGTQQQILEWVKSCENESIFDDKRHDMIIAQRRNKKCNDETSLACITTSTDEFLNTGAEKAQVQQGS